MTTLEIEIAILRHYKFHQNLIVPNVTCVSGLVLFEADMLMLSKSGYATCFEIKTHKSDLMNDSKKEHIKNRFRTLKHSVGTIDKFKTLKNFIYVVPVELKNVALAVIPEFAGLVVAAKHPESYDPERVYLTETRKPKTLNNYKWSEEERYNLARIAAMRIYNLKRRIHAQTQTPKNKKT